MIKTLQLFHLAFLGGQVVLAAATYFLNQNDLAPRNQDLESTFTVLVPVALFGGLMGSRIIFNSLLQRMATAKSTLAEKMNAYRSATIIRFGIMEMPVVLALIAYLLTGNIFFWGGGLIVGAFFILLRPSLGRAAQELGLSDSEYQELEKTQ
ncbi:MAG: hypothetical protein AAF740_07355 [Bacteroidota bacterium]